MTPENFAYWLQGFFEISNAKELNAEQVLMIKKHLCILFDRSLNDKISQLPPFLIPDQLPDQSNNTKYCSNSLQPDLSGLFITKKDNSISC